MKAVQKLMIVLFLLLLILMFVLIYKYTHKFGTKPKPNKKGVLRFPRIFLIVPIFGTCFCVLACVYILLFQFEELPYIILFCVLGLPCLILSIVWSLWRVEIKKDGFIYRNFFGRKVEYKYNDLEYKQHIKGLKWYFYKENKKVLSIPYFIDGGDLLYKLYRKYNQVK